MIRQIGGADYSFTRNSFGWGIVRLEDRTDRFHRCYTVFTDPTGKSLRCSCPHCVERGAWCKHLKEVDKMNREKPNCTDWLNVEPDLRDVEVKIRETGTPLPDEPTRPRWYRAVARETGRRLFVRSGFGEDGTLVAVYDRTFPADAHWRCRPEHCRTFLTLGSACDPELDAEIEKRFDWELNR